MICKTCGAMYGTLVCPGCAEIKSRKAYREYQLHPLRAVTAEHAKILARDDNGFVHLQMFGCHKTFCWAVPEPYWRKREISLEQLNERVSAGKVCGKCHEAFTELMHEARLHSVE